MVIVITDSYGYTQWLLAILSCSFDNSMNFATLSSDIKRIYAGGGDFFFGGGDYPPTLSAPC